MNLSGKLKEILHSVLEELQYPHTEIILETPPESHLGDRSCPIALTLAKELKRAPREIAKKIVEALPADIPFLEKVEIAGAGYLNFFWSKSALRELLRDILPESSNFGSSDIGAGKKHLFEFVSANPTGPMNIVSARAAALGDSFVRLQRKIGFAVQSEFYVNDAGKQVLLLGESVRARAQQINGQEVEIPEGGYHGSYIKDFAQKAWQKFGKRLEEVDSETLGRWCSDQIVEDQRKALDKYGVHFDRWFRESDLHRAKKPSEILGKLENAGFTYEKDGASYFRSTDFGDDEDRVVVTSDSRFTYFLPDIAYHWNKVERGFDKAYDLLGPDHHSHGNRMKAAMRALGLSDDFLEIIIVQQVNLLKDGQPVKMSKRTGELITLDELLDEVGPDAAKQIFLSRRYSSHLDFDITIAKDRSEKSPVFYLQYAHARICSIFRKAPADQQLHPDDLMAITADQEWELLRKLTLFPDIVETAALQLVPHRLNEYLNDLAASFHRFYHECRVLSDDEKLTRARLALCRAVRIVLKEGLRLLGMSAPEAM